VDGKPVLRRPSHQVTSVTLQQTKTGGRGEAGSLQDGSRTRHRYSSFEHDHAKSPAAQWGEADPHAQVLDALMVCETSLLPVVSGSSSDPRRPKRDRRQRKEWPDSRFLLFHLPYPPFRAKRSSNEEARKVLLAAVTVSCPVRTQA